jgi:hypothetical protein
LNKSGNLTNELSTIDATFTNLSRKAVRYQGFAMCIKFLLGKSKA